MKEELLEERENKGLCRNISGGMYVCNSINTELRNAFGVPSHSKLGLLMFLDTLWSRGLNGKGKGDLLALQEGCWS